MVAFGLRNIGKNTPYSQLPCLANWERENIMNGPLSGIRVLALSQYIAGPFGSMLLGDMGAEVIRIEPPEPVANRTLFYGPEHKGASFYYLAFNRSKKSVTLDLRTKMGREAFYDLARLSDVVWDNFRP